MALPYALSSHCKRAAIRLSLPRLTVSRRCFARSSIVAFPAAPPSANAPVAKRQAKSAIRNVVADIPAEEDCINLPPIDQWRKYFPSNSQTNHRVSIRNPDTAYLLADTFVPEGSKDKVIIEAFPGPGQLTRALLRLPKERIKRIIIMEQEPRYLAYLYALAKLDPRVEVFPHGGHNWDAYRVMEELEMLSDVLKVGWNEGVHPQLQFIAHIASTVPGEQLVAQLFRSIPDKQWLFQYGRVPLNFILSSNVFQRVMAEASETSQRCKLSVIAEATAECKESLPYETLQPFSEHMHPIPYYNIHDEGKKKDTRKVGRPFQTLTVTPLEHQFIKKGELDAWDYCVRRMFVLKATSLSKGLSNLAPGAQSLLKKINNPDLPDKDRVSLDKNPRSMNVQEWSVLLKAFIEWPFKPEDLSIDTLFLGQDHKNRGR